MKKSGKFSWLAAGAMVLASLTAVSAFADSRPRNDAQWRDGHRDDDRYRDDRYRDDRHRDDRHRDDRYRDRRRDDRDFLTGRVEGVDYRRGVVYVRDGRRAVAVQLTRRYDLDILRRGDHVTFVGDWKRGGVFAAWRIEDIDRGRRNRRRW